MDEIASFRSNFAKLLKESGLSNNAFAKKAGIAQPQITPYLNGDVSPSLDALQKIAKAFGLTISELFKTDAPPTARIEKESISETLRAQTEEIARQAVRETFLEMSRQSNPMEPNLAMARRMKSLMGASADPFAERVLEALRDPKSRELLEAAMRIASPDVRPVSDKVQPLEQTKSLKHPRKSGGK